MGPAGLVVWLVEGGGRFPAQSPIQQEPEFSSVIPSALGALSTKRLSELHIIIRQIKNCCGRASGLLYAPHWEKWEWTRASGDTPVSAPCDFSRVETSTCSGSGAFRRQAAAETHTEVAPRGSVLLTPRRVGCVQWPCTFTSQSPHPSAFLGPGRKDAVVPRFPGLLAYKRTLFP